MKLITEYLLSKKNNKVYGLLDKIYNDVNELVDDLNIYFEGNLKKPIKVIKTDVVFKPVSPYSKDGIHVVDHFTIEFTNTTSKLRCGHFHGELIVQAVYKDFKGNNAYGTNTRLHPYTYGTNFLEWVNSLKETKWKPIVELFEKNKS